MADTASPSPPTTTATTTTTTISQKRPAGVDDSPLPHQKRQSHKSSTGGSSAHREPREKKETWRKKEAIAVTGGTPTSLTAGAPIPSVAGGGGGSSGKHTGNTTPKATVGGGGGGGGISTPGLVRYRLPAPQFQDFFGHRAPPTMLVEMANTPGEWFAVNDHPMNRRGFRYSPCEASHLLPALSYRGTEYEPFTPRINFEDMNAQVYINRTGTGITTAKGWRMARANVAVREGDWYFECKILNGITGEDTTGGHVRVGWARREAPLDAPVGFDAYSYGLRDQSFDKVHMSRPKPFVADSSFVTGDIIGLHISLPPLSVQRIISGDPTVRAADTIRDRLPIRFKNQLWFEHFEYQPTKEYEDLMNPSNTSSRTPKTLPGSYIRVYRNGKLVGTPFKDLYAFLPPASKPLPIVGGRELDDGALGYYPAVSVFKGGAVEVNFGPEWLAPPQELEDGVRGVWERYDEQIAEDMVYDMVDEVDLLFAPTEEGERGAKSFAAGTGRKEEIKEMVMDDE